MSKLVSTSKVFVLVIVFLFGYFAFADVGNTKHYKLISTVECKGDGVYNSRYESLFKVDKVPLGNNTFQYRITADNAEGDMSFTFNKNTMRMSRSDPKFQLQEQLNNVCVRSLKKNAAGGIGKTWKQSFDLSSLGKRYPSELNFTVTAQKINTKKAGDMIVVRALSEPFASEAASQMKYRANSICVFDAGIESLYMSASVITVESSQTGKGKTILCHQMAALQTDSSGKAIDLGFSENPKIANKYAEFVRKVGLQEKMLNVKGKKAMKLPLWAKADALKISQLSNLCGGYACERGVNPIGPVIIMANNTISMQSVGYVGSTGIVSVGKTLASSLGTPPVTTASFMGVGTGTAALAGGGAAAAAGGFSSGGGGSSSPASP